MPSTLVDVARILDIPEFHDCQRFIVPGARGLEYDSLYTIFAREGLRDSMRFAWRAARADGRPLAAEWILAGVIASEGGTYTPLGIFPGVNCLYLDLANTRARIFNIQKSNDCPNRAVDQDSGHTRLLHVRVISFPPGLSEEEAPPVARWDWDARHQEQYIGIWCPTGWCEIGGRRDFVSSPPLGPDDVPVGRHISGYKGYYDRQLLAVLDGDRVRPSDMTGVVVPHGDLGDRGKRAYMRQPDRPPHYLDVAYFIVDRDYYASKFMPLRAGAVNVLRFRITEAQWWPFQWLLQKLGNGVSPYRLQLHHPGTTVDLGVVWRSHPTTASFGVPATTRWRWRPDDETTWFACPEACCEVCPKGSVGCQ